MWLLEADETPRCSGPRHSRSRRPPRSAPRSWPWSPRRSASSSPEPKAPATAHHPRSHRGWIPRQRGRRPPPRPHGEATRWLLVAPAQGRAPAQDRRPQVAVPIIAAARELEAWLAVHPRRHEARAPLFVNLSNRGHGRRMTGPTIGEAIVRCARRAGIRHVHAHMLRHTSATLKIAKGFPPEAIRLVHGWTRKSTMLGYYTHALPHFERMILQAHGLPSDEPELLDLLGSVSCALCSHANRVTDAECGACGTRFAEAAQESERQHRDGLLLDHVALDAARALSDQLYLAVAASFGWKVPA
ncbi:MAG: tyrosine-type recombinase/integrase [Thermoplasmatota archaeon]